MHPADVMMWSFLAVIALFLAAVALYLISLIGPLPFALLIGMASVLFWVLYRVVWKER